jgi:DNA-directed RNA polymerase specialized sigma24 family protein
MGQDLGVNPHAGLEGVYREHGKRLWWAVLAYSGDPHVASDAVAEAFAQALRRGIDLRTPEAWIWKVAFRVAAAELKARGRSQPLEESVRQLYVDEEAHEVAEALTPEAVAFAAAEADRLQLQVGHWFMMHGSRSRRVLSLNEDRVFPELRRSRQDNR